jgi:transcription antitermination factor NusG
MKLTKTKLFLMSHSQLVSLALEKKLNVHNALGFHLPHVTLQQLIWNKYMLDNNITEDTTNTVSRDLESSWYVLHCINGQEQIVMQKINRLLTSNLIDRKKDLIEAGYITPAFRLHDYILDIGFPREYDLVANKQDQKYNTYVFVELDVIRGNDLFTGQQIFNQVFLPLLQSIGGVKDFVGTYFKVPGLRRTEIIRMNKREKVSRKQVEKIKPSKLPESDYLNIERSHSSFSYYEEKLLDVGNVCWFVPNLDKPHCKHLVKVVKVLTYDKFQVINQLGHKYAVSVNNLWLSGANFVMQDQTNLVIASKVKPLRHKLPLLTKLDKREDKRELSDSRASNILQLVKPVTVTKVTRLPDVGTPFNLYRQTGVSR